MKVATGIVLALILAIGCFVLGFVFEGLLEDHQRLVQVRQLLKDEGHPIQMDQHEGAPQ